MLKSLVGFWLLAWMVFHAMPVNNPADPRSSMSPVHPDNVRLRLALADALGGYSRVTVEWFDIWPALVSLAVSLLSTVVLIFMMAG